MASDYLLSGRELVLVAQVPKAGGRWKQVHFNREVIARFFGLGRGKHSMSFQHVDQLGQDAGTAIRTLVLSLTNLNRKIEFSFGKTSDYPAEGPPLLVILELDAERRHYRYQVLLPGEPGYTEMRDTTESLPSVGQGHPRVITTLDEVELRWPGCRLRNPRPGP